MLQSDRARKKLWPELSHGELAGNGSGFARRKAFRSIYRAGQFCEAAAASNPQNQPQTAK